jgi:hypothetical protein
MKAAWLGLVLVAFGGVAGAAPLKTHGGSPVRVAVEGKREAGVGLKAQKSGWKLALTASADEVADVFDVTAGANSAKWSVEVRDGALFFDNERFIPGHAYRVVLHKGMDAVGSTLVYLYPPPSSARNRVTFEDDSASAGAGDGDIAISKKPTL